MPSTTPRQAHTPCLPWKTTRRRPGGSGQDPPPGQARTLGPSSSRASKDAQTPLLQGKQDPSPNPSSRASKDTHTILLQGKQELDFDFQVPSLPSYRASKDARTILLQGNQAPRGQLPARARCLPHQRCLPPRRLGPPPACLPWKRRGYPLRTENPPKASRRTGRWVLPKKENKINKKEKKTLEQNRVVTTLHCGRDREYWEIEAKKGLPSADRNNKATLLLTGPFRTAKSSAKDLIPHPPKLQYASRRRALPARRGVRLLRCEAGAYSHAPEACGRCRRVPARILT